MKFTQKLLEGRLIKRYKRFFADVELSSGEIVTAHCPNTGSMKNCLVEGGVCWVSESDNPKRKLKYTLEAVTAAHGGMAGVNTGLTNKLVKEALQQGVITELADYPVIETEVRFGEEKSRLDFRLSKKADTEAPEDIVMMEVKNVTLGFEGGLGKFPDAVTTRGAKHLRELLHAKQQGFRAVMFFCVQHTGIDYVEPAWEIDPNYAETLSEVMSAGVEVLCYGAELGTAEFSVKKVLSFQIGNK